MIEVKDLRCRYLGQDFDTLHDINFTIPGGNLTLISGPTGSGKSTLGFILCGAIPHLFSAKLSGSVTVCKRDPTKIPVHEMARHLGFLAQNVEWQLFTDSVIAEVAFGMENFAVPVVEIPRKIDEALDATGVAHLKERRISTLSAGERQRVTIASLLCLEQKVLILDEPLAYLDHKSARNLLTLLRSLSREGKTVIVIEHRRDMLLPHADRELYLDKGTIADASSGLNSFFPTKKSPTVGKCRLEFDDVSFTWGNNPLLEGVSFDVRAGESVVLLGDNGSGKTTIMKLAMGLLKKTSGSIKTCGLDASKSSTRKLAANTAFVLQNPDHQIHLPTVGQEVGWAAPDPESAARELEFLGLKELEERHPHSLSVGQKRRVTLAAALARKPSLLLLDEPTVGQDDSSLDLVFKRLGRFTNEGGALLSATHDSRAVKCLGHKVVSLQNGRVTIGGDGLKY